VKLLVVGGDSRTGMALQSLLAELKVEHKVLTAANLNLLQKMEVAKAVSQYAPTQIINVASYSNLELAERDTDAARLCDEQNSLIPAVLAEVCGHLNLPLLQHSSSLVFDGAKAHPYVEEDPANPLCRYGRSKWYGERAIRDGLPAHIILRTDWVFSERSLGYFQSHIENCKAQQGQLAVINNRFSPTSAADVARVIVAITRQVDCAADVWGTYHYCAQQPLSQDLFVEHFLQEAGRYDEELATLLPQLRITKQRVQLPYIANSVVSGQKLFDTFGIKARSRSAAITALLRYYYQLPTEPAVAPVTGGESESNTSAKPPVRVRKPKNGRRPSRKAATRKG
jgi:dTDP-4-dehydrorhamnose reductase